MIKTLGQAVRIQKQRTSSGKFGYSKAVARFIKRSFNNGKVPFNNCNNLSEAFYAFPVLILRRPESEPEDIPEEVLETMTEAEVLAL